MKPQTKLFIQKSFFIYAFVGMTAFMVISPDTISKLTDIQIDETSYSTVVSHWNAHGFSVTDNKPIFFLGIQRFLIADKTVAYTRALNYLLIAAITLLIWEMSHRKEAFLFFLIPWFLNSMWLTVEIIEVFFVLLAVQYSKYSGWLVGLAIIFRPYAILYAVLLKKRQWISVAIVGLGFVGVYLYLGIFWDYLRLLFGYGTLSSLAIDYVAIVFYGIFFVMGIGNKTMIKYGIVASIPILIRQFGHYFLPAYTFFFLGYLLSVSKKSQANL